MDRKQEKWETKRKEEVIEETRTSLDCFSILSYRTHLDKRVQYATIPEIKRQVCLNR